MACAPQIQKFALLALLAVLQFDACFYRTDPHDRKPPGIPNHAWTSLRLFPFHYFYLRKAFSKRRWKTNKQRRTGCEKSQLYRNRRRDPEAVYPLANR